MIFGQSFELHDIAIVGLLIVLEGVLSIDNALVLGILAKRLPKHQQSRALTYGLVGAFVFRVVAIVTVTLLMKWTIAKLLGGAYLIYIALKHFFFDARHSKTEHIAVGPDGNPILVSDETGEPVRDAELAARAPVVATNISRMHAKFWPTVAVIELTDIAFAIDSILAAYAMVSHIPTPADGLHPKTWVVVTGGMLGVILMRFAAILFIKLLERFPRFEVSAYLLVIIVGLKLTVDWGFNREGHHVVDFHSPRNPAFWIFWGLMVICFAVGFIPRRMRK